MTKKKPVTVSEHQSAAVKARWAKTTPAERSAYARKMVAAREAKRAKLKESEAGMCSLCFSLEHRKATCPDRFHAQWNKS